MPEICLIGTGGMMPLKERWLTSCYIEHNGKAILIDCGEGTQIALAQADCKISRIDVLLLTHMHADHVAGLPGFLLSLGNSSRTEPLDIYLPEGKTHVIRKLMCICEKLPFELVLHELSSKTPSSVKLDKIDPLLEMRTLPLKHSVDCIGYSFTYGRKPVFLPDKAKALNIPVQQWRYLHMGETVILADGRSITPDMVTGEERRSVKVTYVTDTLPISEIAEFADSSDLFICEGMYGELDKKDSMNKKGHMLMQDACRLAEKASVQRLWLTHYSPAVKKTQIYEKQLKKLFDKVVISCDGEKITL